MRKFISALSLCFIALICVSSSYAQKIKFNATERKLITIIDERRNADSLAMYLADKNTDIAYRAAIGIANLEDTSVRPQLIARLAKETRPQVIDAIALALGILGANAEANKTLMKVSLSSPTNAVYTAIGRTVRKEDLSLLSSFAQKAIDGKKVSTQFVSRMLIEIALRKLMNPECAEIAASLTTVNDPITNWQATYAFARTEDSALVFRHIDALKQMLYDLGSAEARMFAATALGRIHNDSVVKILMNTTRSEQEWRVRVNLFSALGKAPRLSSALFDLIKKAVNESDKEIPTSQHIALTALGILDNFISAGKLSASDSETVRIWLDEFRQEQDLHEAIHPMVRAQALTTLVQFGYTKETHQALKDMIYARGHGAEDIAWQGLGRLKDTTLFQAFINRIVSTTSPVGILPPLEALNIGWQSAKKDTAYMRQLEYLRLAAAYRHMLIRLPGSFTDASIVSTAMTNLQDSTIITDSLRSEADEYLLKHLDTYSTKESHDQLLSVISAVKWLKPKDKNYITTLSKIYERAANEWSAKDIMDSVSQIVALLGSPLQTPLKMKQRRSIIDWNLLENSPDTLLIQYTPEFMFLKLDKYNAPLTCLNMIKLAKMNFFANNIWHRVVPNFVIQAGDPDQTGYGGPGYSIRREISLREYDTPCVVGMASDGKDTEGSQWFATHLPTPHLNTRYTIWGDITGGKIAVEKIQRGEKMDNIIPFSQ